MTEKCFIDSNIWIYALTDDDPIKAMRASTMLSEIRQKVISWQIINEVCVNLIRKKRDESFIVTTLNFMRESCEVIDFTVPLLEMASHLRSRNSISFWDSLVVATALVAECDALLSEDFQQGQRYGQMVIHNIFA